MNNRTGRDNPIIMLQVYAEAYYLKLSYEQKHDFEEVCKRWEAQDNEDSFITYSENFESDIILKTFFLRKAEHIPTYSNLHSKAFKILDGEELDFYYQYFVHKWKWERKSYASSSYTERFRGTPRSVNSLISNKDFKVEYILPFLKDSKTTSGVKYGLLWEVANKTQDVGRIFTKKEVSLLIDIANEQRLSIRPIIPSIKEALDLGEIPDSWILEAYGS